MCDESRGDGNKVLKWEALLEMPRWPKRREMLFYYLLYRYFGDREFNIEEGIQLLRAFTGSRKIATRIIRRLVKQGFILRTKPLTYRARSLEEVLDNMLVEYLKKRLEKRNITIVSMEPPLILIVDKCDKYVSESPIIKCAET